MREQARSEQDIVKALAEALKRADDQLLVAVRNIALEHEMRRDGILRELQALATCLGGFPISRVLAGPLQDASVDLPNDETNQPQGALPR
jgi:hypothetical protein